MPSFFNCATAIFRAVDLFPNSKIIRYNGQSEYTTTTGGIISAAVIIIFIILFASMGLKTVEKKIINSSVYKEGEINPEGADLVNGPGGDFMFGIFIYGLNLNLPFFRFFDVTLVQEEYSTGYILRNSTQIPLVQCSKEHFSFNEELTRIFQRLPMTEGLCPQIGQQFSVEGKVSSSVFKDFKVSISRCNATTDPTCAPDANFTLVQSMLNQFTLVVPLINVNINPSNEEYKTFYFQDKNYFMFNQNMGISAYANIQQDVIETDVSIMPYEEIVSENVINIPDTFASAYYLPNPNQPLAQITFQKAKSKATYSRSFNKIDNYFSYVGGLVGTILGLIFIMGFYTEKAYEISLARKIFLDHNKQAIQSSSFSIFYYFSMTFKKWLEFFKIRPNWPKTETYIQSCQEVCMQIDITYLVRKLMFLDAAIEKLMEKHEIEALCLKDKPTIDQVKEQRKKHFANQLLRQHRIDQTNIDKGELGGTMDNVQSKQRIVFEGEEVFRKPEKQRGEEKESEDVSAIEFSDIDGQVQNLKTSVLKVVQQSRKGRVKSRQLLKGINLSALKMMGVEGEEGEREKSVGKQKVESGKQQESIQEIDYDAGRLKKGDFDYNFDK